MHAMWFQCAFVGLDIFGLIITAYKSAFIFQYKSEKDGVVETRIERKITVEGDADDDDDIDHDFVSANVEIVSPDEPLS